MKKILIMFLVAIIFIYPIHNAMYPQHADAAIASKAASQAAKQIAKEVIQDIAVETAANYALHQAMNIAGDYEARQGYKVVCPDGSADCAKPIQVKETITDTDKQAIKGQAGSELDKLLNGGSGVSKWQKFLDWFLPVWLISFGATALTYAFDSDVRSLFNEAGYNALVALGLIIPIDTKESIPLNEVETEPVDSSTDGDKGNGIHVVTTPDVQSSSAYIWQPFPAQNVMFEQLLLKPESSIRNISVGVGGDTLFSYAKSASVMTYSPNVHVFDADSTVTVYKNGEYLTHKKQQLNTVGQFYLNTGFNDSIDNGMSIDMEKLKSVRSRLPYKIGDFWYTDVLFNTVSGNVYETQLKTVGYKPVDTVSRVQFTSIGSTSADKVPQRGFVFTNEEPNKKILPPVYSEDGSEIPVSQSNYEDDSGNVALIPPTALTFKEESTGETVYRVPSTVPTDPPVFQKEDGTIVPEENITVGPDPVITPSPGGQTTPGGEPIPEGTPTVTPAPSPSNPSPQPIPLTPTPTPTPQPDPNTPPPTSPPIETTPPAFPEGESCDEGLKIPKFLPLLTKISETFPFSIPFDLYGGFEAIFAEMGKERPEFDFKFNALGEDVSWKITIPDFIDDWKPFTDSFLIFIFDVGIVYAIFRFTGGGK